MNSSVKARPLGQLIKRLSAESKAKEQTHRLSIKGTEFREVWVLGSNSWLEACLRYVIGISRKCDSQILLNPLGSQIYSFLPVKG